MSKRMVFIITFLLFGTAMILILSMVTGKKYNRSYLMDAWFIWGLMVVINIFLSLTWKWRNEEFKMNIFNFLPIMPVSYTHLDVYKRQKRNNMSWINDMMNTPINTDIFIRAVINRHLPLMWTCHCYCLWRM